MFQGFGLSLQHFHETVPWEEEEGEEMSDLLLLLGPSFMTQRRRPNQPNVQARKKKKREGILAYYDQSEKEG